MTGWVRFMMSALETEQFAAVLRLEFDFDAYEAPLD
jgi:hypothetical protein